MFNSLASYLFGKSKENNFNTTEDNIRESRENSPSDQSDILVEINDNIKVTAISCDEDRDWLLVEKENHSSDDDTDIVVKDSKKNLQLVPFKNILSHLSTTSDNDEEEQNCLFSANLPALYPNSMDDSFLLLPPSCFSSASIQLESSPLENLLLEHASMSVYCNIRTASMDISKHDMVDDMVVLELTQADMEENEVRTFSGRGKKFQFIYYSIYLQNISPKNRNNRNGAVKNKGRSSNGANKNMTLVIVRKDAQKGQDQRKMTMGKSKSAIERNNKRYYAPKKRTNLPINQPSSRTSLVTRKN